MRGRHNEDHQEQWDGDLRNLEQNSKEFQIEQNIVKAGGWQSVQIPPNMKMQIKVKISHIENHSF